MGELGHEHEGGVGGVEGVAFGLEGEAFRFAGDDRFDGIGGVGIGVTGEVVAEVVAREHEGAAGVFLFAEAVEVAGETDLGLHLFLAVAVVVVGDEGDHDAAGVAGAEFEGAAAVVELVLALPAHAVAALAGRGEIVGREADEVLGHADEVGGEDDAAGVTGPAVDIEAGVVFGQIRVAGVAEDGFDEIEVGNEGAGCEEADLHAFLADEAGDGGHHERAQHERDEALGLFGPAGGVGQAKQVVGRAQGEAEHPREGDLGDGEFVVGNRQAAFGDVENALGGAAVLGGIVEDAVAQAVALEKGGFDDVAVGGEGELAGEARLIEDKGARGQARGGAGVAQVSIEEVLDAFVDGREALREPAGDLALLGKNGRHNPGPGGGGVVFHGLAPEKGQAEVDGVAEIFSGGRGGGHGSGMG